jgi:hypothetical protein
MASIWEGRFTLCVSVGDRQLMHLFSQVLDLLFQGVLDFVGGLEVLFELGSPLLGIVNLLLQFVGSLLGVVGSVLGIDELPLVGVEVVPRVGYCRCEGVWEERCLHGGARFDA